MQSEEDSLFQAPCKVIRCISSSKRKEHSNGSMEIKSSLPALYVLFSITERMNSDTTEFNTILIYVVQRTF